MVVPNSAVDVTSQLEAQIKRSAPPGMNIKVQTAVKSIKILMPDGAEVEAALILQDSDLDLALVRAKSDQVEAQEVQFVPTLFTEDAPRLQAMDEVLVLGRLGQNLSRQPTVRVGRVESAIRRPRLIYRPSIPGLGHPVFTSKGELAGVYVRQIGPNGPGDVIIRPVKDVLKVVAQADESQPEDHAEDGEDA